MKISKNIWSLGPNLNMALPNMKQNSDLATASFVTFSVACL